MNSKVYDPINLGSDEMISMNDMAKLIMTIDKKELPIKHIPGPEGVRGRNSNNDLIKKVLGWAPSISLREGIGKTIVLIQQQIVLRTIGIAYVTV